LSRIHHALHVQCREQAGRKASPTAAIIDSQSVKSAETRGFRIVERTIAWLSRCRRLSKDWENLNDSALAFIRLASIRLMLRKLCNPA
jgi:transposase